MQFNGNMKDAPRDGRMLMLIVSGGESRLDDVGDEEQYITMGNNNLENTEIDTWQIVGWNWSHDFITQTNPAIVWAWFDPSLKSVEEYWAKRIN